MGDGMALVLSASIPAALALISVIWQSRKTRKLGTAEHVTGRDMIENMHADVRDMRSDMSDVKADVHGVKSDLRTLSGRVVSLEDSAVHDRRVILAAVEDHVDYPGEGA